MSQFSEAQLEHLKSRLLPFGAEWTALSGRALSTARDGIDFLAAMKNRDDFWASLAPDATVGPYPLDLSNLRALLPTGALGSELAAEDYLRSLGLSDTEIASIVGGLDESDFLESAIRTAFGQGKPQSVARALERILDTNADILATQSYVSRVSESRVVARTVSAMMGIALLLVGTACPPPTAQNSPRPPASPQSAPASPPAPVTPSAPTPTPAEEPVDASTPTSEVPNSRPEPTPPQRPPSRPNRPPSPTSRYKGVSPRRRTSKLESTPKRELPT